MYLICIFLQGFQGIPGLKGQKGQKGDSFVASVIGEHLLKPHLHYTPYKSKEFSYRYFKYLKTSDVEVLD